MNRISESLLLFVVKRHDRVQSGCFEYGEVAKNHAHRRREEETYDDDDCV